MVTSWPPIFIRVTEIVEADGLRGLRARSNGEPADVATGIAAVAGGSVLPADVVSASAASVPSAADLIGLSKIMPPRLRHLSTVVGSIPIGRQSCPRASKYPR